MKTQKELSKGCGKDYKNRAKQFGEFIGVISECDEKGLCPTCQSLFQQNKEFIEMIEERMFLIQNNTPTLLQVHRDIICKELEEIKSSIIIGIVKQQQSKKFIEMIEKWWKSIDIIHDAIKDNNKVITPEEFEELKSLIIGERMTEEELKYERELEKGDY